MNRVSVRTLVLVVELFAVFVIYQCMVYLSPIESPTQAVQPQNLSHKPAASHEPTELSQGAAEALGDLPEDAEGEPESLGDGWPQLSQEPPDPNDRIEPEEEEGERELTAPDVVE